MLHGGIHTKDSVAYFTRAIIYKHKMFMKLTPDQNGLKVGLL
jgi:hypothetical protein